MLYLALSLAYVGDTPSQDRGVADPVSRHPVARERVWHWPCPATLGHGTGGIAGMFRRPRLRGQATINPFWQRSFAQDDSCHRHGPAAPDRETGGPRALRLRVATACRATS